LRLGLRWRSKDGVIGSGDGCRYTSRRSYATSGLAEELAQDALVAAKHRAIDRLRRIQLLERKHAELGRELEAQQKMTVPRQNVLHL
jgi:hypothetical protein